jgi:hypothetical protein
VSATVSQTVARGRSRSSPERIATLRGVDELRGRPDLALFGAGLLLFLIALASGSTFAYGLADFCFAGGFFALLQTVPTTEGRSPELYRGGATLGGVCAFLDGILTLATATGALTSVLTVGILVGFVAMIVGASRF